MDSKLQMFTANVAAYMLQNYPDISPYDLKPSPHNILPVCNPDYLQATTRARLASHRLKTGTHVMKRFGDNPFTVPQAESPPLSLPLGSSPDPSHLKKTLIYGGLFFLEQVTSSTYGVMFKVRVDGDLRLFKIFRLDAHDAFSKERRAYEYLTIHADPDAAMRRAVLKCYGHVTVSPAELAGILTVENISQDAAVLAHSNSPLDALLLDYKPGATIVTVDNVTEKATEAALRSLYVIHTAHVLHGSVGPGSNILFDSINAYWINFENSQCGGDTSLDRQTLFKELEDGWDYLYACLLSDKHLGITSKDLRGSVP